MMKKLVSLMLVITLCLSLALPASAMMVSTITSYDDEAAVEAMAAIGDRIYYLSGRTLYTRTTTDPNVTEVATFDNADEAEVATPNVLCTRNNAVYGINLRDKSLYLLVDETGAYAPAKQSVTLDTSALFPEDEDDSAYANLTSSFVQEDHFYYTAQTYTGSSMNTITGRIDLTSGVHQAFKTAHISNLTPYKDGKVLAHIYDSSALYSNDSAALAEALKSAGELAVFDPEKDAAESSHPISTDSQYGGMTVGGFCYGNGSAYYINGSKVMGMDMTSGEVRTSAYTAAGMFGGMNSGAASYVDGYYVTYGYDGLSLYQLDSENLSKGALRIYGEMGSEAHKSFVKNHPEIPVEVGEDYTTSLEAITQAMVSDTNPYDVLILSLNFMPVDRLLKKGYCADLSAYTDLKALVDQMYPEFAQVLQQDGKLYGVPTEATAYTYGVNMELWEELGLTEDDLPTSIPQLLDFAANWVYDYGEDNPDIFLFNYGESAMMLFSLILQDYMAYTQYKGEPMLFDTPAYRAMIDAYEKVDFSEIDGLMDTDSIYIPSDKALFSLYNTVVPVQYQDERVTPLYLSFVDGEEAAVPVSLSVMIINPKTTRMDSAVLYMRNYLENLPKDGAYVTLFPEHNDPVERKGFQKSVEEMTESLENAKQRLETADPENRAAIQDEIKSLEESLEDNEQYRYALSAEHIRQYREDIKPKLFVQRQNMLYSASNEALTEINTIMMQYIGRSIDADKMISDLDNRLRLMALEDD